MLRGWETSSPDGDKQIDTTDTGWLVKVSVIVKLIYYSSSLQLIQEGENSVYAIKKS